MHTRGNISSHISRNIIHSLQKFAQPLSSHLFTGHAWRLFVLTAFPVGRYKLLITTFRAMWRKRLHHPQPGIQLQSRCKCNVTLTSPAHVQPSKRRGTRRMHRAVLHSLANIAKTAEFFTIVEPRGAYIAESTITANGAVNARRFLDILVATNSVNGNDSLYNVTITASNRKKGKNYYFLHNIN